MEKLQMKRHKYSGKLITFCGLDGCGKTTMIELLEKKLLNRGYSVVLTKQPTPAVRKSEIFRNFMDSPEHGQYEYRSLSLLAASDRIQHTAKVIEPMLKAGKIVISDRYFYSCLANLRARGYQQDQWIYEIAESIIEPDVAIFLDIDVETAIQRVRKRTAEKDRFIDIDLQYRLRKEYQKIANVNKYHMVKTDTRIEDTLDQIIKLVQEKIE